MSLTNANIKQDGCCVYKYVSSGLHIGLAMITTLLQYQLPNMSVPDWPRYHSNSLYYMAPEVRNSGNECLILCVFYDNH